MIKSLLEIFNSMSRTLLVVLFGVGILAAGLFAYLIVVKKVHRPVNPVYLPSTEITNFYNVTKTPVRLPFRSRLGGIDELNGRVVLVRRTGEVFLLDEEFKPSDLNYRVPTNVEEYATSKTVDELLEPQRAGWANRSRLRFGVRDILVEQRNSDATLYATYYYWYEDRQCMTVNVAGIRVNLDGRPVDSPANWQHIFETSPCMGLVEDNAYIWTEEGGGRLISLGDGKLLLTVGEFGYKGLSLEGIPRPQIDSYHYGKTILLDPVSGQSSIYTKGHRNPQGLVRTPTGEIYSTEHGPHGGDELNLIEPGENYGWPLTSYGSICLEGEACVIDDGTPAGAPFNETVGEHSADYRLPVYSWVPSIGISNVISVRGNLFPLWKGDLLVSSLKQKTLYRVRIREGRAVFAEPLLNLGLRIRDLIELQDGRIILKPDDHTFFVLQPDSSPRAKVVTQCAACHTFRHNEAHGIGPNLWDVMDRGIASAPGFEFSSALGDTGGKWNRRNLEVFLRNPQEFAPGSSMAFELKDEDEIDAAIDFLETLTF